MTDLTPISAIELLYMNYYIDGYEIVQFGDYQELSQVDFTINAFN